MHKGSCHCGAVRLTLPSTPEVATQCNCSLCRRIGGPWVYFEFGTVAIEGHPEATEGYIQGDRTLRTIRCRTCGCVTHWEPLDPKPGAKQGVHLGNFDPALIASVRVRRFDGADTWKFFDELEPETGASAFFQALEIERTRALVDRDVAAIRRLHAPDYELISVPGRVMGLERYLSLMAIDVFYASWEHGPMRVKVLEGMAAVRYPATITFPSGKVVHCWHTDIYALQDGAWRAVWSQATELPPDATAARSPT